jgi:hypothetical protein
MLPAGFVREVFEFICVFKMEGNKATVGADIGLEVEFKFVVDVGEFEVTTGGSKFGVWIGIEFG